MPSQAESSRKSAEKNGMWAETSEQVVVSQVERKGKPAEDPNAQRLGVHHIEDARNVKSFGLIRAVCNC